MAKKKIAPKGKKHSDEAEDKQLFDKMFEERGCAKKPPKRKKK